MDLRLTPVGLEPTPVGLQLTSISDLNEESRLWWWLKKKVFEAAVPQIAFGTNEEWNIVSQMQFA